MSENILEIKDLCKSYKGFSLNKINITLPKGYIMGFIGPNGAGKSTTIKLILNLIKRDSGEIKVFGLDNIKDEMKVKNRIGFVFDECMYYDEFTISQMKWVIAKLYKSWDENAYEKYIEKFSLPKDKKIKELSKGMKMKFSLAMALSHNADLLIMDEPTSGLDPVIRSEMLDILFELVQDENKGVFFSTHITSDLEKVADYITYINNGEIMLSDEKDIILENYALVKGSKENLDTDVKKYIFGIKENQFGFEAVTKNKHEFRSIFGDTFMLEKASLEDIMLGFTRKSRV